jgi:hypothetical protein
MSDDCNKSAEVNGGTPFAEARGSLSGLSVQKLLAEWAKRASYWRESEEQWRRNLDEQDIYDAVRMNCCRVRAKTLEDIIGEVRAELAATNQRQPTGNEKVSASGDENQKPK